MWSPSLGKQPLNPNSPVPPRFSAAQANVGRPRFGSEIGEKPSETRTPSATDDVRDTFEPRKDSVEDPDERVPSEREDTTTSARASDSGPTSSGKAKSTGRDALDVEETGKPRSVQTKNIPKNKPARPPRETTNAEETRKLTKAVMFSSVVPILSSLLWLGGPLLGVGVGVPIAYLSGIYGRRLHARVDTNKINDNATTLDQIVRTIAKAQNMSSSELAGKVHTVFGSGPVADAITGLATSRFAKNKAVRWLLGHYHDVRKLEKLEPGAKATSKASIVFDRLCKGFAVNLAVAKEGNPFKAAFAGAKAFIEVALAWFFLPFQAMEWFKDRNKNAKSGANPA